MKKDDFSVPRRMSKSACVIMLFNNIRKFTNIFFIFILLKVFNSDKEYSFMELVGIILLIFSGCIVLSAILAFIEYYYKKYYVENGELIFKYGFIHRETTSIPLNKIQSLRTKRGLMYRLLDMTGISFDTLASKNAEIELILDDEDWKALLSQVETQEKVLNHESDNYINENNIHEKYINEDYHTNYIHTPDRNDKYNEEYGDVNTNKNNDIGISNYDINKSNYNIDINDCEKTKNDSEKDNKEIRLSNINLIKGALCQNHFKGMAVLLGVLGTLYNNISTVNEKAISNLIDYVDTNAELFSLSVGIFVSVFLILYFIVMLLWIGNVFLRYFNMEVIMDKEQLFFESGLITRMSSRFSYDKVCTVYIKQNFLEKWLGCCTVILRQAFNATDNKNESNVQIYGSGSSEVFLNWWLGKEYVSSEHIISAKSGYGLFGYTIRFDIVIFIAAVAVMCYYDMYLWLFIPAIYMLIAILKGMMAVRRSCITLKEDYIEINNGKLASVQNYFKYGNIEVVRLVSTPFTHFWGRVNLVIATNGTYFTIRSLKANEARDIYEILTERNIPDRH